MRRHTPVLILFLVAILSAACSIPSLARNLETQTIPSAEPNVQPQVTVIYITPMVNETTISPTEMMANERFVAPDGLTVHTILPTDGYPEKFRDGAWIVPTGYEGRNDCFGVTTLGFSFPPVNEVTIPGERFVGTEFNTCGWGLGELVTITLTHPDGTQEISTQTNSDDFGVNAYHQFGYGSILGMYTITFAGESGTLEHQFTVYPPEKPVVVKAADHQVFFYGLVPHDVVVVGAYRVEENGNFYSMTGWGEFMANSEGMLMVEDKSGGEYLVGIGEMTGLVYGNSLMDSFLAYTVPPSPPSCDGAPTSRLSHSVLARVTLGGGPNNVRAYPGLSNILVGQATPGEELILTHDLPICSDGMLWWSVWARDGSPVGWTSEGQGSNYWLEPVK